MGEELTKLNFRDVGGLPTSDGSQVRSGVIFRSEGPASFQPVHERELDALGIRLICDLRADSERQKSPNTWAPDARLLNIDINSDVRVGPGQLLETLGSDQSVDALREASRQNYAATARALRPRVRELVQAIVDGERPALIHCTAGKDRTGVLVALILEALGVPEEIVVDDYLRSDVYAQNLRLQEGLPQQIEQVFGFLPDDEWIDVLIGVDEEFIRAALQTVRSEWGTVEDYLSSAGVSADLMARFRELMTVPAPIQFDQRLSEPS
jgi:protein-tyrosine phosphatase